MAFSNSEMDNSQAWFNAEIENPEDTPLGIEDDNPLEDEIIDDDPDEDIDILDEEEDEE